MPKKKSNWDEGVKTGRLTLTGLTFKNKKSRVFVETICQCGCLLWIRSDGIGLTQSCGCLDSEKLRENPRHITHGLNSHPLWNVYRAIKDRCYRPSSNRFENYGAKGVTMCEEWLNDYVAFYNWAITSGWKEGLQLDKDLLYKKKHGTNTGMIYSPEYCCFLTSKENNRHRSTSRYLEYKGESKTLAEWAEEYGLSQSVIYNRLKYLKWSVGKSISTPALVKIRKNKRVNSIAP